jgi:hypothetical protein
MNDGDLRTSDALAEESMSVGSMEAEKNIFRARGTYYLRVLT